MCIKHGFNLTANRNTEFFRGFGNDLQGCRQLLLRLFTKLGPHIPCRCGEGG
jgi:hypothetical protein